jgi:hypothetical protein
VSIPRWNINRRCNQANQATDPGYIMSTAILVATVVTSGTEIIMTILDEEVKLL